MEYSYIVKQSSGRSGKCGAQIELINLYDLDYKGCIGCLACKVKEGKSLGHCAVNDDLKSVLDKIDKCDGLILGSPIYLGDITAMMRALWERLIFQYLSYDDFTKSLFNGTKNTAFIYTMGAPESQLDKMGYTDKFQSYEMRLKQYFGNSVYMISTENLQVMDYSKYNMALFNEADRKKRREEVFPNDCLKAFDLGKSMVNKGR